MLRSMMQVVVNDSADALEFYRNAFGAEVRCKYTDSEGRIMHAELNVFGQVLAVCDLMGEKADAGSTMMFCLEFGEGKEETVRKIYDALKEGAVECPPLVPCDYSTLQSVLVDKYGVRWCIYV